MKIPPEPPVGFLIAYEYLWESQAEEREDGVKSYPSIVVFRNVLPDGVTIAYVAGISHMPPGPNDRAVEVPLKLKTHLGLDDQRAWVYTDQLNAFIWPGPDVRDAHRLSRLSEDSCVIGRLPDDWFETVKAHILESNRLGRLKPRKRTV